MMQNNQIQDSINSTLSLLPVEGLNASNLLAQAKGGRKVKRKLSVVLVLTIVMVLVALGALAAVLLSMRDMVEQEVVPLANQTAGESLTAIDTNRVLELAEENGIQLSEEAKDKIRRGLDKGEGYFKWEMLMELAKADFGQQPQTWTLEQQKWFSDVTVAMGLFEQADKETPREGESEKLPIIQAAKDYIRKKHDNDAPLDDPQKYQIGVQYINGDVDGDYPGLYWSIDFQPEYLEGAEYWVFLRDDMTVFDDWVRPGLKEDSQVNEIRDHFLDLYGWDISKWNPSVLRSFKSTIELSSSTNDKAFLAISQTNYPNVRKDAITKEAAAAIAARELKLESYIFQSAVFIDDVPHPVWKVCLYVQHVDDVEKSPDPFSAYSYHFVEIDSITGEVNDTYVRNNRFDHWYLDITLQRIIDEIETNWVDDIIPVG